jgi:hypothetical protein
MNNRLKVFAVCMSLGLLAGCSSQNAPPQKGTPAFYWLAANETYAAGDYAKTVDHLRRIVDSGGEYTDRALPWLLVMTSGMAAGYADLAESYEAGARVRKSDPAPFRKNMSNYRTLAGRYSLQFADVFEKFEKTAQEAVTLDFTYPAGSPVRSPLVTKLTMGAYLQGVEPATAERRALERGVLLQTCGAAGAPNDAAKTQEMFKSGRVQTPRNTFLLAMAGALYDHSQLYIRRKMDEPDKLKILCGRAVGVLKELPESKERKELLLKIEKTLKENKVS